MTTGCSNDAITLATSTVNDFNGSVLGMVQLRYFQACQKAWGRILSYVGNVYLLDGAGEHAMEKCSATLRFFGPTLDHQTVTTLLGQSPSYAHLPGERRNRVGKPIHNGMWLLSSEKQIESTDPEDHMSWLLDQVEGRMPSLLPYLESIDAEKDISCSWEKEGNGGAYFSSFFLKRLAALDLALGVTIYFLEEPDEEMEEALKDL